MCKLKFDPKKVLTSRNVLEIELKSDFSYKTE